MYSRNHFNYVAIPAGGEAASVDPLFKLAIVSVEKGAGKRGGGEDLKAIVRYPKEDHRLFLSVPVGGRGRSFTAGGLSGLRIPGTARDPYVKPLIASSPQLGTLQLAKIEHAELAKDLLNWELRFCVKRAFKFGVLLQREGQTNEDEMYSNGSTAQLEEFLSFIGDKIKLQGWNRYRGGLDVKKNTTGKYSYFTEHRGYEIMFHVAPLLPDHEKDVQRLERKRHLGNDVIVIVFSESTTVPFPPQAIHSHFNHVFVIVSPVVAPSSASAASSSSSAQLSPIESSLSNSSGASSSSTAASATTHYRVTIAQKSTVGPHTPFLARGTVFQKNEEFRQFFLTKLLNAERSALQAPVFLKKNSIARMRLLEDLVDTFKPKFSR